MTGGYPADWEKRRKRVYERDDYQCQRCGRHGGPHGDTELHAHHITPKSKGGSHHYSNLETLCQHCHSQVHGRTIGTPSSSSSENSYTGPAHGLWAFMVYIVVTSVGIFAFPRLGMDVARYGFVAAAYYYTTRKFDFRLLDPWTVFITRFGETTIRRLTLAFALSAVILSIVAYVRGELSLLVVSFAMCAVGIATAKASEP